MLARAAEGSLRDGLSLLEQAIAYAGDTITDAQVRELLGVVAESVLDDLVEAIAAQSAERALGLVHRLIADGQNLQHFCREAIRHFRNLLVARVCGADSDLVAAPQDERPRLAEQAAQFSEEDLTRFFNILLATDDDLRRKPDPRLHLELGLLRLINAQRLAPLEEAPRANFVAKRAASGVPYEPDPGTPPARDRRPRTRLSRPRLRHRVRLRSAWRLIRPRKHRTTPLRRCSSCADRQRAAAPAPVPAAAATDRRARGGRCCRRTWRRRSWTRSKRRCRGQRFLWSLLEHATRWEMEGGEFRLFFSTENRALAEMLPREAMERLRTAVNQVVGQPLRVCVKLDSSAGRSEPQLRNCARGLKQDPIVRAMLEKFGGQISRVKRPGEE